MGIWTKGQYANQYTRSPTGGTTPVLIHAYTRALIELGPNLTILLDRLRGCLTHGLAFCLNRCSNLFILLCSRMPWFTTLGINATGLASRQFRVFSCFPAISVAESIHYAASIERNRRLSDTLRRSRGSDWESNARGTPRGGQQPANIREWPVNGLMLEDHFQAGQG